MILETYAEVLETTENNVIIQLSFSKEVAFSELIQIEVEITPARLFTFEVVQNDDDDLIEVSISKEEDSEEMIVITITNPSAI